MSVSKVAILAYLSAVSLPMLPECPGIQKSVICFFLVLASSNLFCTRIDISLGFVLFLMLFMALRESLRIMKLVCSDVFIFSMAFKIAIDSAESIEHLFGILYVIFEFEFLNMIAMPTTLFDLEASVNIFWCALKSSSMS